jgi:hypothetical protein
MLDTRVQLNKFLVKAYNPQKSREGQHEIKEIWHTTRQQSSESLGLLTTVVLKKILWGEVTRKPYTTEIRQFLGS